MTDQKWQLIPEMGIECGGARIFFDQDRAALNNLMANHGFLKAKTTYPDEDDFLTTDESTFIRIRYSETNVKDIEFLCGKLQHQGIDLHSGTTFSKIKKEFKAKNLTFRETEWLGDGKDCPELRINITTREDVGGDGEEIEWVILSKGFNNHVV